MVVEKTEFHKGHFVIVDWDIRNSSDGYEKLADFCLNDPDFLFIHPGLSTRELIIADLKKYDSIGYSVKHYLVDYKLG